MNIIAQGAESIIKEHKGSMIKERPEKKYRLAVIDEKLRKTRTTVEANILMKLGKLQFPVPRILHVEKSTIIMEVIKGKKVRDVLTPKNYKVICPEIGKRLRQLHDLGIIHGDVTTSNMMLDHQGKLYIIDFGLSYYSQKIEDKAVDLHLLRTALESKHYQFWEKAFQTVVEQYDDSEVIERLQVVEQRGRNKEKY